MRTSSSSSIRHRSGSSLVLAISVLTVLAVLGTVFLSQTQQERFSSSQNSVNTEADLLIEGLRGMAAGVIPRGLFGVGSGGRQLRLPSQEMPVPTGTSASGYVPYESPASDVMLSDRVPAMSANNGQVSWGHISWPMTADSGSGYSFDSPFGESVPLHTASNKMLLEFQPAYRTVNGRTLPAMVIFLPAANVANFIPALPPSAAGYYLTPSGPVDASTVTPGPASYDRLAIVAASAAGDGIADAGLWKVPVGPINGITYFAGVKIIDQNSAINASTAWRSDADPTGPTQTVANNGYFRSNVGLFELLASSSATQEMQSLNAIRFGGTQIVSFTPVDDSGNLRTDFQFTTYGDAIDSQLSRRLSAPGFNVPNQKFGSFAQSDAVALPPRFSLIGAAAGSSKIEQCLANELVHYPNARSTPYSANEIENWYSDLFNYPATFSSAAPTPLRPLLTVSNPVSNAIASRFGYSSAPQAWSASVEYQFGDWVIGADRRSYICLMPNTSVSPIMTPTVGGIEYWATEPWTSTPVKASANTATFEQLWLSYCHVMTDSQTAASPTAAAQWLPPMSPANRTTSPEQQLPMFRSVIRDNRSWPVADTSAARVQLSPMQMMQLRAAIAAVNTVQLRNAPDVLTAAGSRFVVSRHITLADRTGKPEYDAEIFGADAQPYINSMYAHTSTSDDSKFIAVELVNPYPVAIPVTSGWSFATIDRSKMPTMSVHQVGDTTPTFVIPAAVADQPGIVVIEDGNAPTNFPQPTSVVQIPGLIRAIGRELMILKTRRFDGTMSKTVSATQSGESFDEANAYDLVPVDQIDMTGTDAAPTGSDLYYRRAADPGIQTGGGANYGWNFVWPGRYNPYCKYNSAGPTSPPTYMPPLAAGGAYPFFQSIVIGRPPKNTGAINPDFSKLCGGPADPTAASPTAPTYSTITMHLNRAGINPIASTGNQFPFGGFARNGDLLEVPFIGAYRITPYGQSAADSIVEMNSVTMDCSLADDQTLIAGGSNPIYPSKVLSSTATDSVSDPFVEQIGRFCPIGDTQPTKYNASVAGLGLNANALLDFGSDPQYWHYHWAKRLFDYLTVQAPHDDYFPNVDPTGADYSISPTLPARYLPSDPSSANTANNQVLPVANRSGSSANASIGGQSEDTAGVEGLININTAPWRVLSMIPWVPRGTDNISDTGGSSDSVDDNINLARAIVSYRNLNGPFASISDLYNVPVFRLENDRLLSSQNSATSSGNAGPAGSTKASRLDFAGRFRLLNQASSLITTRSDTFTCYLLLQGWRNADTSTATLAVERRAAFLADRTAIQPTHLNAMTFRILAN